VPLLSNSKQTKVDKVDINQQQKSHKASTQIIDSSTSEESIAKRFSINNLPDLTFKELLLAVRNKQFNCDGYESLYADPNRQAYSDFIQEFTLLNFRKLNSYTTLSDTEIVSLSDVGDEQAMYVLGMNSIWKAYNDTNTNPLLLGKPIALDTFGQYRDYDAKLMSKGRELLYKVSLTKYPSALIHLASSYITEISQLSTYYEKGDSGEIRRTYEEEIREAKFLQLSILKLMQAKMPIIYSEMIESRFSANENNTFEFSEDELAQFDKRAQLYIAQWENDRLKSGSTEEIILPINKQDFIDGIRKTAFYNICEQYDAIAELASSPLFKRNE